MNVKAVVALVILVVVPVVGAHGLDEATEGEVAGLGVQSVSSRTALQNSLGGHGWELAFASPTEDGARVHLWVVNASSGEERQVAELPLPANRTRIDSLAYDGRYIAWADDRTGRWQVYVVEASTGAFQALTRSQSDERQVRLSNGTVVWSSSGEFTIHGLHLESGERFEVGSGGGVGPGTAPDIFRDRVVWARSAGGLNFDVFVRDLPTGRTGRLTNDTELIQATPRIWEDRLIWVEGYPPKNPGQRAAAGDRPEGTRVVIFDLATGARWEATPDYGPFKRPEMAGNWAAWLIHPSGLAVHDVSKAQTMLFPAPERSVSDVVLTEHLLAFTFAGPSGVLVYADDPEHLFEAERGQASSAFPGWPLAVGGVVLVTSGLGYEAWRRRSGRGGSSEP